MWLSAVTWKIFRPKVVTWMKAYFVSGTVFFHSRISSCINLWLYQLAWSFADADMLVGKIPWWKLRVAKSDEDALSAVRKFFHQSFTHNKTLSEVDLSHSGNASLGACFTIETRRKRQRFSIDWGLRVLCQWCMESFQKCGFVALWGLHTKVVLTASGPIIVIVKLL